MTEQIDRLLGYLEDDNSWEQWRMGELSAHQVAALLPSFMSVMETALFKKEVRFWTHRASIFYTSIQMANYMVYEHWGEPAKILPWEGLLNHIASLPADKRFLFIGGKFRTLPTEAQSDSVIFARKNSSDKSWHDASSALIFEPKVNIEHLEGKNELVFDPQIRSWAYGQLPVDVISMYPEIKENETVDEFYEARTIELRAACKGVIGTGIGLSSFRERAARCYQKHNIQVLDTSVTRQNGIKRTAYDYDTSELDKISSTSETIEKFILSYLRHMGQISV